MPLRDDDPKAKWNAVYGAALALQVERYHEREGTAPGPKDFVGMVEEAEAIADCAAEAVQLILEERGQ